MGPLPRTFHALLSGLHEQLGDVRASGATLIQLERLYSRMGLLLTRLTRPLSGDDLRLVPPHSGIH